MWTIETRHTTEGRWRPVLSFAGQNDEALALAQYRELRDALAAGMGAVEGVRIQCDGMVREQFVAAPRREPSGVERHGRTAVDPPAEDWATSSRSR